LGIYSLLLKNGPFIVDLPKHGDFLQLCLKRFSSAMRDEASTNHYKPMDQDILVGFTNKHGWWFKQS